MGSSENIKNFGSENFKFVKADVTVLDDLKRVFDENDFDFVFHEAAVELYKEGEVSIERASEIAGVNVVQFKEILAQKGITRWIGSGEDELKRRTEELKKAKRQTFKKGLIQN